MNNRLDTLMGDPPLILEPSLRDPALGREEARQSYLSLEALLAQLAKRITHEDADLPAYIARLPFPYQEKDTTRTTPIVQVQTESLLGEVARRHAAEIVVATTYQPDQHMQRVLRVPGLLSASPETLALVDAINAEKKVFETAFMAISPSATIRKEHIAMVIRAISVLQTYRLFPLLDVAPAKVSFTWTAHSPKTQRLTVAALRELLNKARGEVPEDTLPETWEMTIGEELSIISDLPGNEYLAIRKPLAPHPRVNLYLPGEDTPRTSPASLPVFYPDTGSESLPPINPLDRLDMRFRRAQRSNTHIQSQPLIKRLHIYRYVDRYRKVKGVQDSAA